ncbi:response regulator transcription factor [uncultured Enterococcus sp.]|uniref:response regulator transcription factor n=1 Tax=uncultured Enterococcus sp. TaxID=167972 RepID=UPI0025D7DB72|nr:response regulator transcription factor [uncultured Enterococcus sp.]
MEQILIIEDDEAIAMIEKDFLEINGYQVTVALDGETGLNYATKQSFDLIILDIMIPKIDGLTIMKTLRSRLMIPILFVTAKTDEIDRLRGLGIGADDYICKPFSPTELVARVKSNLATYDRLKQQFNAVPIQNELVVGPIRIQPQAYRLWVADQEVTLKRKEFELLLFMMEHVDQVLSKEQLYDRIWGGESFGDLRTVVVHINRLREKIERDPAQPKHIQTVWGAGYKFIP